VLFGVSSLTRLALRAAAARSLILDSKFGFRLFELTVDTFDGIHTSASYVSVLPLSTSPNIRMRNVQTKVAANTVAFRLCVSNQTPTAAKEYENELQEWAPQNSVLFRCVGCNVRFVMQHP
jgi:hypothetical protein